MVSVHVQYMKTSVSELLMKYRSLDLRPVRIEAIAEVEEIFVL